MRKRGHATFRRETRLAPAQWQRLQKVAASRGPTPLGIVLSAYAETISRWTSQDAFTLAITLLNRLPVHPHVDQLVGDFTSVDLLEVRSRAADTFAEGARTLQAQLWRTWITWPARGVEVLRELGTRRGRAQR